MITVFKYISHVSLTLQLAVLVTSGWLVGQHQTEVVWRCVWTVYGELSVMTSGPPLMPMWLVDSWVTLEQVCWAIKPCVLHTVHGFSYMWQSRVKIEGFSVAYFDHIAAFKALYRWTSVKGGAHTCFLDAWISNESTSGFALVKTVKQLLKKARWIDL